MTFPCFDAKIDILGCDLPPGVQPGTAVAAVRKAVLAIPGAAWVSVLYCGQGTQADHAGRPEQIRVAFVHPAPPTDAATLKALAATLGATIEAAIRAATEAQASRPALLSVAPLDRPQHREAG
jgi:hypothetical protein